MCNCEFCQTYNKYKWAIVMECKCQCHKADGITGHDNLCCEFPNALLINNPHDDLKHSGYYLDILKRFEREWTF